MSQSLVRTSLFLSLLLLPLATGCVKRSTYRTAIAEAQAVELGLRSDMQDGWDREEGLEQPGLVGDRHQDVGRARAGFAAFEFANACHAAAQHPSHLFVPVLGFERNDAGRVFAHRVFLVAGCQVHILGANHRCQLGLE